jgi:hypothetical protein
MRRLIRTGPEPEPDPEENREPDREAQEAPDEEDDEAVEVEHGLRQFPKVRDALLNYEDSGFQHQFAIGDLLLEEIGPPGKNGANNESGDLFEDCSQWLHDEGLDYSARTLKNWRDLAHKVPASFRQEAEEAGVSITVILECLSDLDVLRALMAAQEGERPTMLADLTTVYRGEEVPAAAAIRQRRRISVSDAKIALGRLPAGG